MTGLCVPHMLTSTEQVHASLRPPCVQGDNNVMCLQTARFLLKALLAVQSGHGSSLKGGSAAYLSQAQQGMSGARSPAQVGQC
jgi:hypothetical protein